MRRTCFLATLLAICLATASAAPPDYPLHLSANGRQILDSEDTPVFFNAESGWHIMTRLSREEAILYLDNRVEKGFNAVLVMLMVAEGYHGTSENRFGDGPFQTRADFAAPNEDYFAHVDWVLQQAYDRGITIFLAPCYTGYECGDQGWCREMKAAGAEKMRAWGRWVGNRFRDQPNIIWVNGGDADARAHSASAVVDAVAEGIREVDDQHLHTAHCNRYNSGADCYDRPWLDINTSYADCQQVAKKISNDYARAPHRPFVFIEGRYEFEKDWSDQCMRGQAYASLLGGAVGHFFGSGKIWGFFDDWKDGLDSEGSYSMGWLARLLETRRWDQLLPDYTHEVLIEGHGDIGTATYASSAITADGMTSVSYLPSRRTVRIAMDQIQGEEALAQWLNPETGEVTTAGSFPTEGTQAFYPPSNRDWLLIIDSAEVELPPPGDTGQPPPNPDDEDEGWGLFKGCWLELPLPDRGFEPNLLEIDFAFS